MPSTMTLFEALDKAKRLYCWGQEASIAGDLYDYQVHYMIRKNRQYQKFWIALKERITKLEEYKKHYLDAVPYLAIHGFGGCSMGEPIFFGHYETSDPSGAWENKAPTNKPPGQE